MTVATNTINPSLYKSLPFDFQRDIAPVAGLPNCRWCWWSITDVPAKNVAEFVAYAKANPGKVNIRVVRRAHDQPSGDRTAEDLQPASISSTSRIPAARQMITDLISGRVQAGVDALPNSLPHIRSGSVRALAVMSPGADAGASRRAGDRRDHPGSRASTLERASASPSGTPPEIVERLNREINAGLATRRC